MTEALRSGYTTGSCAAAAAKAAMELLFGQDEILEVSIVTPKGVVLYLQVREHNRQKEWASCAIEKDSGDDPDVTNGVLVYAKVTKTTTAGIQIIGGLGVGTVTRAGLDQPIGAAAINSVPRKMIRQQIEAVREKYGYQGGIQVEISIPKGLALADKTFNPKLGIVGGISVLGTSGIVEPMSKKALIDTIALEINMKVVAGAKYLVVTPGNYGTRFLAQKNGLPKEAVKCSNYIGETIDIARAKGVKGLLLVGHVGKLIKVTGGIFNTHSSEADCRLELLVAQAVKAGVPGELLNQILQCVTTEDAVMKLKEWQVLDAVMKHVSEQLYYYLNKRAGEDMTVGAVMFSNQAGYLTETKNTKLLLQQIQAEVINEKRE